VLVPRRLLLLIVVGVIRAQIRFQIRPVVSFGSESEKLISRIFKKSIVVRHRGWRNSFLGTDSGAPYTLKNKGSVFENISRSTGIDSHPCGPV
jgi:hypothetical protein